MKCHRVMEVRCEIRHPMIDVHNISKQTEVIPFLVRKGQCV